MNCIIVEDEEMSRNLIKSYVAQTDFLNLVGEFPTPVDALNFLKKNEVDLIFLDIEMPGMTGYDLLRSMKEPPLVILITSRKDYAIEAFEFGVTDFLVKPATLPRFMKAVNRAKDHFSMSISGSNDSELFVRSDFKIIKIAYDHLLYIEALADYVTIFTDDNKYIVHSTMKGLHDRLPGDKFMRVHRSFIINMNKIHSIENQFVVIGGRHIPIGASYKDDFMGKLNML